VCELNFLWEYAHTHCQADSQRKYSNGGKLCRPHGAANRCRLLTWREDKCKRITFQAPKPGTSSETSKNDRNWRRSTGQGDRTVAQTVARPCANCVQLKSIDINWTYCWVLPRLILFMRPICLQAVLYTGCDSRTSQDIQFGMFVVEQGQRIDVKWGKFSFLLLHLFFFPSVLK